MSVIRRVFQQVSSHVHACVCRGMTGVYACIFTRKQTRSCWEMGICTRVHARWRTRADTNTHCSSRPRPLCYACVNTRADLVHSPNTGSMGGQQKTCSQPVEDWEGPFIACALDNADPMLINWLRKTLGARARARERLRLCTQLKYCAQTCLLMDMKSRRYARFGQTDQRAWVENHMHCVLLPLPLLLLLLLLLQVSHRLNL